MTRNDYIVHLLNVEVIHDSDYSILWLMLIFGILLLIFGSLAHGF